MNEPTLTQQKLKEVAKYDSDKGQFISLIPLPGWKRGRVLGCHASNGYVVIVIDGKAYKAHRLAWLYVYGEWPSEQIDHINQNKSDNRISNLRVVDNITNCRNQKKDKRNTSGVTGVYFDKRTGRWRAIIGVNMKNINLGFFASKSEAAIARKKAEIKYRFHLNHGI